MGDLTSLTVDTEQFSIGQTLPSTATSGQIMRYFNGKWSPVSFGVVPSGNSRAGLVLDNYGAPSNGNFNFGINNPGGVVGGPYLNQSFSSAGQDKIKELATAAQLTGLDTSQGGAVTASDTVLSAIGKLQANSGGGSAMPIHVELPKSASDPTPSGLEMLVWPDGKRYVYAASSSSDAQAFIPPEYMGVGEVYIREAVQIISTASRATAAPFAVSNIGTTVLYNSVVGNATDGATVSFAQLRSGQATSSAWNTHPGSTHMTFYVNPNVAP